MSSEEQKALNEIDAIEAYVHTQSAEFDRVGTYLISKSCDSSVYPCEHMITNLRIGSTTRRNGLAIHQILKHWRLSHPHFNQYDLSSKHNADLIAMSNSLN